MLRNEKPRGITRNKEGEVGVRPGGRQIRGTFRVGLSHVRRPRPRPGSDPGPSANLASLEFRVNVTSSLVLAEAVLWLELRELEFKATRRRPRVATLGPAPLWRPSWARRGGDGGGGGGGGPQLKVDGGFGQARP